MALQAATYYVRTNGLDSADGESWENAWATIHHAVDSVSDGATILVSNGLYVITSEIAIEKELTLQSVNGADVTEIRRDSAAPVHRILYINHADAVVEGFTIANGQASTSGVGTAPTEYGGGVYVPAGLVTACILTGNTGLGASGSEFYGGGAYIGAEGRITHSLLNGNSSGYNNRGYGSAAFLAPGSRIEDSIIENTRGYYDNTSAALFLDSDTQVMRCTIRGNRTEHAGGGGIDINGGGNILIQDCIIHDNVGGDTGGIHVETTSGEVWIRNSLIARNCSLRDSRSGGVFKRYGSDPLYIENCTIVGNIAFRSTEGGGLGVFRAAVVVRNSIITDNVAPVHANYSCGTHSSASLHFEYTCTFPLPQTAGRITAGDGNIADAPVFVDAAFDPWGFRPQGAYDGSPLPGNARPVAGSPTINAGTTNGLDWMTGAADLDGNDRVAGGAVDMGCFEYHAGVLDAGLTADAAEGLAPHTVELTAHVYGSDTAGLFYVWDFGDGSAPVAGADKAVVTNTYAAGLYDVTLTVSNAAQDSVTQTRAGYVKAAPATVFLSETGLHQLPFATPANAATDIVSAVDMQVDGGTIQALSGRYPVPRTLFLERGVTLRGDTGNPASVVLDAGLPDSPFYRVLALTHDDAVVEGVTITGGRTEYVNYSDSDASGFGNGSDVRHRGAGALLFGGGLLQNCVLTGNSGTKTATAVLSMRGGTVRNCLVYSNEANSGGHHVLLSGSGNILENCTIVSNIWVSGTYVHNYEYTLTAAEGSVVANSIVRFNLASYRYTAYPDGLNFGGNADVLHCNFDALPTGTGTHESNQTGDLLFADRDAFDYRLQPSSPCVDAGVNRGWEGGAVDLDGNARLVRGVVDLGVYEYPPFGAVLFLK